MVAIQQQPAFNYKAFAWTVGAHCLLFLVFFSFRYAIPATPPPHTDTLGMEVNLGTSDNGSGHDQPMKTGAPAAYRATAAVKSAPAKSAATKEIARSQETDAPEINNNSKNTKPAATTIADAPPKPHIEEKPKYSYPGDNGTGGNDASKNKPGSNEGNGTGPGDKGKPGGDPNSRIYTGAPGKGGFGLSPSLINRGITPSTFVAEFNEGGVVVVSVTVDRNGNIINKSIFSSSNHQLDKIAMDKLNHAKFGKIDSPEPQAFGKVTIRFTTQQ